MRRSCWMPSSNSSSAWAAVLCLLSVSSAMATDFSATIVLRWTAVESAVAYELQIASDEDFKQIVVQERVQTNGFRWQALPDMAHHWRVRSVDAEGRLGPWSPDKRIEPVFVPPEPVTPATGARVALSGPVTLSFAPRPPIKIYRIEVASDRDFATSVLDRRIDSNEVAFQPTELGSYYWRVRSVDASGRESGPSAVRNFDVV